MSRTVAGVINGFIDLATLPLNRRQRNKTIARISQNIEHRGVRDVITTKGNIRFYSLRGSGTASAIERFHDDEPETLEWIDTHIKQQDTFWDIGANIGLYSLYAALTKDVTVYAFEPSALNFGLLVEHIELNRMGDSIKPLCMALGKETRLDALHIGEFATGHASNALGQPETQFKAFDPVFSQAIPAFTTDEFCKIFKVSPPDHIKLDVDGIEDDILAGMKKSLPHVKTIVIEVEGRNTDNVASGIEKPLHKAGFEEDERHRSKGSERNRLYINQKKP